MRSRCLSRQRKANITEDCGVGGADWVVYLQIFRLSKSDIFVHITIVIGWPHGRCVREALGRLRVSAHLAFRYGVSRGAFDEV